MISIGCLFLIPKSVVPIEQIMRRETCNHASRTRGKRALFDADGLVVFSEKSVEIEQLLSLN
jgi:hypothetical protein